MGTESTATKATLQPGLTKAMPPDRQLNARPEPLSCDRSLPWPHHLPSPTSPIHIDRDIDVSKPPSRRHKSRDVNDLERDESAAPNRHTEPLYYERPRQEPGSDVPLNQTLIDNIHFQYKDIIERLTANLNYAECDHTKLRRLLHKEKLSLKEGTTRLEQMENALEEAEKDNSELRKEVEAKQSQCKRLKAANNVLRDEIASLKAENNELMTEQQIQSTSITRLQSLVEQSDSQTKLTSRALKANKTLKETIKQLENEKNKIKKKLNVNEAHLRILEDSNRIFQQQIQQNGEAAERIHQSKEKTSLSKLRALEETSKKQLGELAERNITLNRNKEELERVKGSLTLMESDTHAQALEITTLQEQLAEEMAKSRVLKAKLEQVESRASSHVEPSLELSKLKTDNLLMSHEIRRLEETLQEMEKSLQSSEDISKEVSLLKTGLEISTSSHEKTRESFDAERKAFKQKNKELQNEIIRGQATQAELLRQISQLMSACTINISTAESSTQTEFLKPTPSASSTEAENDIQPCQKDASTSIDSEDEVSGVLKKLNDAIEEKNKLSQVFDITLQQAERLAIELGNLKETKDALEVALDLKEAENLAVHEKLSQCQINAKDLYIKLNQHEKAPALAQQADRDLSTKMQIANLESRLQQEHEENISLSKAHQEILIKAGKVCSECQVIIGVTYKDHAGRNWFPSS